MSGQMRCKSAFCYSTLTHSTMLRASVALCKQASPRRMRPLKRCKRGNKHVEANNERKHQNVISPLLLLPMHLIFDILVSLRIYAIFSCKRVCQTFKKITSDPYFAQVHLAKSLDNDFSVVIQENNCPSNIFLAPVLDLDKHALCYNKTSSDGCNVEYLSWQTLSIPNSIPKSEKISVNFVGSYNGFLCLTYYVNHIIYLTTNIWKPNWQFFLVRLRKILYS